VRSTNPRNWLLYSAIVIIIGSVLVATTGWAGIILIIGGVIVAVRSLGELRG
jgi:hypothetical protein